MKRNISPSMKAASVKTAIPLKILKLCKHQSAPGFNVNNSIDLDDFLPWYELNKEMISKQVPDESLEDLKKEIARRDIQLKDLQIKAKKENLFTKEELIELLTSIAGNQSAIIKKIMSELKPKVIGLDAVGAEQVIDKATIQLFEYLQQKKDEVK